MQDGAITVTVSGKLLAAACSAVTAAGQSHLGGPHAAGNELGGGPAYGPWLGHSVLACHKGYRSAFRAQAVLRVYAGHGAWA